MKRFNEIINNIVSKLHFCIFNKPLVSRYTAFNTRDIIYECRCGKRKSYSIYREFGNPFPIENKLLLSEKEYHEILEGSKDV